MNFDFFCRLYSALLENEFLLLKGFYDNEQITSESKFITLYKNIGSVIYAVNIINKDVENCDYETISKECFKKTCMTFKSLDERYNIIFLNVLITKNVDKPVLDFADSFYFDNVNSDNAIYWIVDLNSNNITVGKNQPDKIGGIYETVMRCFENLSENQVFREGDSVFYYVKKNKLNKKSEIKSRNCILSYMVIVLNIIIFIGMEMSGGSQNTANLIKFGAVEPSFVLIRHEYYRLVTSTFIHIGIFHLMTNSLCIFIFGPKVEMYFGKKFFNFVSAFGNRRLRL